MFGGPIRFHAGSLHCRVRLSSAIYPGQAAPATAGEATRNDCFALIPKPGGGMTTDATDGHGSLGVRYLQRAGRLKAKKKRGLNLRGSDREGSALEGARPATPRCQLPLPSRVSCR